MSGLIFLYALAGALSVALVLFLVRLVHERMVRVLEPEGIVRRSGRVRIRLTLRGYRGPVVRRASSFSIRTGELVLTGRRLVLVMPYLIPLGVPPWSAVTTELRDGKLYLMTEEPPEAQGKVEVTLNVPEPETWIAALQGARAAGRGA